jgi:hypothetical protein
VTETLTRLFDLEPVPADWGLFDVQRLATAAEMAETGNHCVECGVLMVAKVGGGVVTGTVFGFRADVAAPWGWQGPYCYGCEKAENMKAAA